MNKLKKIIQTIPKPLKNKYFITLVLFSFWILFIDDYNLIKQYQLEKDIKELKQKKEYYTEQTKNDSLKLHMLKNNKKAQEKFARENFLMKKKNEDVFKIRKKHNE